MAAGRVEARHDVFDRAVLAGRVERLDDKEERVLVPGVKAVLQLEHFGEVGGEVLLGGLGVAPRRVGRVAVLEAKARRLDAEAIGDHAREPFGIAA